MVQGTIAPDWIESGGGLRDTIKSHHNVGGLPEDMDMILCEPIRELYKDEVRSLAEYLEVQYLKDNHFQAQVWQLGLWERLLQRGQK